MSSPLAECRRESFQNNHPKAFVSLSLSSSACIEITTLCLLGAQHVCRRHQYASTYVYLAFAYADYMYKGFKQIIGVKKWVGLELVLEEEWHPSTILLHKSYLTDSPKGWAPITVVRGPEGSSGQPLLSRRPSRSCCAQVLHGKFVSAILPFFTAGEPGIRDVRRHHHPLPQGALLPSHQHAHFGLNWSGHGRAALTKDIHFRAVAPPVLGRKGGEEVLTPTTVSSPSAQLIS